VEGLFDRWEIDLIGPLPLTPRGKRFIAVAVEGLTRWPEAAPLTQKTGAEVANFIYTNIYCRYGCPRHIQTDNGSEFKNETVEKLLKKWKIPHHFSTPYHPQSQGLVERYNKTLCDALARHCQGQDWDLHIEQCLLAYRTNNQATTHRSPANLLYGQELTLPIDLQHDRRVRQPSTVKELQKRITALNTTLPEDRHKAQQRTTQSQDLQAKDKVSPPFKEGDKVYRHLGQLAKSHSAKMQRKWDGPYIITKVLDKGAYLLQTLDHPPRRLKTPIHGSDLQLAGMPVVEI